MYHENNDFDYYAINRMKKRIGDKNFHENIRYIAIILTADNYLGIAFGRRLVGSNSFALLLLDLNVFVVHFPEQAVQCLLILPILVKDQRNCCDNEHQSTDYTSHNFAGVSCNSINYYYEEFSYRLYFRGSIKFKYYLIPIFFSKYVYQICFHKKELNIYVNFHSRKTVTKLCTITTILIYINN